MASYFYEAGYNASKYDTSEALLHAQVAILADKYDCQSLYKLRKSHLQNAYRRLKATSGVQLLPSYTTLRQWKHQLIETYGTLPLLQLRVAGICYGQPCTTKE